MDNTFVENQIEFESDKDLNTWWVRLLRSTTSTLSDIPYSYHEVQRELVRRDNIKEENKNKGR